MTRQRRWLRSFPVLGACLLPAGPNAGAHLLPEAGAQRTLEAVSSRPLFGAGMRRAWRSSVCPMALECLPQYRETVVTPRRVS
jgi:hypothetical protein